MFGLRADKSTDTRRVLLPDTPTDKIEAVVALMTVYVQVELDKVKLPTPVKEEFNLICLRAISVQASAADLELAD
jgi:hypothetical protein